MDAILLRTNGGERALVPFVPMSPVDVLDRLSTEMWDSWKPFGLAGFEPRTDIFEEKGELVMKTELPGIDKKDIDITLEGDRLTIKAEKKEEVKEDAKHHTREVRYGSYYRTVRLPYPVKEGKILATLEKGVLELRLPKPEEVKPKRVEIRPEPPKLESARRPRRTTKKTD